ncbi:MAG: 6-bladed beta-propeller [Bacteroidales bacterium]|nr:6-bladed beta-propeller [Bacteroidales bacterium]
MKKSTLFFSMLFFLVSCSGPPEESRIIKEDRFKAKDYFLDEIADSVKIVVLEKGPTMGEIFHIKSYGSYLFLYDISQELIHLYDIEGHYISSLTSRGQGPEEYLDLATYAYNPDRRILTVFSRNGQNLIHYSVPDMKFLSRQHIGNYIMSMEYLNEKVLWVALEQNLAKDIPSCIGLFDIDTNQFSDLAIKDMSEISLEFSADQTVFRKNKDSLYYCFPSFHNKIYLITPNEAKAEYTVEFGRASIPEKYWNWDEKPGHSLNLRELFQSDRYAFMPVYFVNRKTSVSFWYMTKSSLSLSLPPVQLCIFQNTTGEILSVKNILLRDLNIALTPSGIAGDYYISLLYPGLLETLPETSESPVSNRIIKIIKEQAINQDSLTKDLPLLVMYKLQ